MHPFEIPEIIWYDGPNDPLWPCSLLLSPGAIRTIIDKKVSSYECADIIKESIRILGRYIIFEYRYRDFIAVVIFDRKNDIYNSEFLTSSTNTVELLLYDHFVYMIVFSDETNTIYQPDTGVHSIINFDDSCPEYLRKDVLTYYLKLWRRLPHGSKRAYNPILMEYPKRLYPEDPKKMKINDGFKDLVVITEE